MESSNPDARVFPARMSALPDIEEFLAGVCARHGIPRDLRSRLSLLVEELFTNTVRHGHGRDSDEPVALALEAAPGRLTVTYEDTAPPHDPFAAPPRSAPGDTQIGGVGLRLIAAMSSPEYRYANGRNQISLVIATR
jgi:anti-sigma regulatory factor (Ser/Thr protein kinase)